MEKAFVASLCREGVLGGGLYMGEEAVTFRTNKLTVPPKYRDLKLPYREIRGVEESRLAFLPTVTLRMTEGESYRFLVFGRKSFLALLGGKLGS